MRVRLLLKEIVYKYVRKNCEFIQRVVDSQPILLAEFNYYQFTFTEAGTNLRIPHGLGFLPTDVIQSRKTGSGNVTWNYELFDSTYLDVTVDGACSVSAFIGGKGA